MTMRRLLWIIALCLVAAPASAQVVTSGSIVVGHAPVFCPGATGAGRGVICDGGPALRGALTELGITNTGTPLCINDAPITGSYHQLCLGTGVITVTAYRGATSSSLNVIIDGISYPFPGSGNGNVVGVAPTTTGDFAVWNGGNGALLKPSPSAGRASDTQTGPLVNDGSAIQGSSNFAGASSQTIYNQAVLSASPTQFQGYDGLRGVTTANPGSTINTATGVAGYTLNNTVPVGQRTQTVSLMGVGVCAVDGSQCWGIDTIVSDNPTSGNTGATTGGGRFITNEFDLNITSPLTTGNGLAIGGTAIPTGATLGINGVAINKLWGAGGSGTGTSLFANGFIAGDACCLSALTVGASALGGASKNSMIATFNYRAGDSSVQNMTWTATPSGSGNAGTMFLGGTGTVDNLALASGSLFLPANQGLQINLRTIAAADNTTIAALCSDITWTVCNIGNTSTLVALSGNLRAPEGFVPNGSVATALTSLGPAGSHPTVQEWFTIQDAAGVTRYIPGF